MTTLYESVKVTLDDILNEERKCPCCDDRFKLTIDEFSRQRVFNALKNICEIMEGITHSVSIEDQDKYNERAGLFLDLFNEIVLDYLYSKSSK